MSVARLTRHAAYRFACGSWRLMPALDRRGSMKTKNSRRLDA